MVQDVCERGYTQPLNEYRSCMFGDMLVGFLFSVCHGKVGSKLYLIKNGYIELALTGAVL